MTRSIYNLYVHTSYRLPSCFLLMLSSIYSKPVALVHMSSFLCILGHFYWSHRLFLTDISNRANWFLDVILRAPLQMSVKKPMALLQMSRGDTSRRSTPVLFHMTCSLSNFQSVKARHSLSLSALPLHNLSLWHSCFIDNGGNEIEKHFSGRFQC